MEQKSITAAQILRAAKLKEEQARIEWRGLHITVKHFLPLEAIQPMLAGILELCAAGEEHMFKPELLEFSIRAHVLLWYTNIELPKDLPQQYQLVMWTDLYHTVAEYVCDDQLADLRRCAELCCEAIMAG